MSTEDEVRDLMSRASALPYGRGRSQLWAEAAALAESAGLEELALRSNLALIPAYTNGGEGPKLLAPFIWCNAVYKRRPELFTEKMLHRLGWDYKYVITALRFIPTVPRDQCLDILEEMGRYYLSRGDSMRAYYIHGHLLYRDLGEEDAAEEADFAHEIGSGHGGVEIGIAARDLRDELVAADFVRTGVDGLLGAGADGEDQDPGGLAGAVRKVDCAADHLVGLAGIDAQAVHDLDRGVEFGGGGLLRQTHGLQRTVVDAVGDLLGSLAVIL